MKYKTLMIYRMILNYLKIMKWSIKCKTKSYMTIEWFFFVKKYNDSTIKIEPNCSFRSLSIMKTSYGYFLKIFWLCIKRYDITRTHGILLEKWDQSFKTLHWNSRKWWLYFHWKNIIFQQLYLNCNYGNLFHSNGKVAKALNNRH